MEKLVIVRDAKHNRKTRTVSIEGERRIISLAKSLFENFIDPRPTLVEHFPDLMPSIGILTSPVKWIKETADLLARRLQFKKKQIKVTEENLLHHNPPAKRTDINAVIELIKDRKEQIVIVVANSSLANVIALRFTKRGKDGARFKGFELLSSNLDEGEAWLIDFEEESISHIF